MRPQESDLNNQPRHAPGMLVWVALYNCLENRAARGKFRPALLLERRGGQWQAVCFTTRRCYRTGDGRIELPQEAAQAAGLTTPSMLWSSRTYPVSVLDVGRPIGWANPELVAFVLDHVEGISTRTRVALRRQSEGAPA